MVDTALDSESSVPKYQVRILAMTYFLLTTSNASVERANSRALKLYQRSPNMSHSLVEALLLLRSVHRHLPNLFDQILADNIHAAREKAEVKVSANIGQFLNDGVELV